MKGLEPSASGLQSMRKPNIGSIVNTNIFAVIFIIFVIVIIIFTVFYFFKKVI